MQMYPSARMFTIRNGLLSLEESVENREEEEEKNQRFKSHNVYLQRSTKVAAFFSMIKLDFSTKFYQAKIKVIVNHLHEGISNKFLLFANHINIKCSTALLDSFIVFSFNLIAFVNPERRNS